jgi:phosphohistidine phosphatase
MTLYLLRHADAEDYAITDFDRKLTPKGHDQANRVGKFCADRGIAPSAILTSPYIRARETAEIVGQHLGIEPLVQEWIGCGMSPSTLYKNLIAHGGMRKSLMVVGHEPDMGYAVTSLLGLTDASAVNIRKATLTGIEAFSLEPGAGTLDFCIPARLV